MTNETLNPFRPTRWEHHGDGNPLIWFTSTADELAGDKPAYVYGSRGSGKTSLLKSICWEDLCYNKSLKLQKSLSDFPYIGIYIRFPDHISGSMSYEGWKSLFPKSPNPDYEYHRFFSLLVELICCERVLSSCHTLRVENKVSYPPNDELSIVETFTDEYSDVRKYSISNPTTFIDLSRTLRNIIRRMNESCSRGTVSTLAQDLPPREPYQLLSFLTEQVSSSVKWNITHESTSTKFKFCFDDCEVLNSLQRKSLNSLIRLSRSPISWVVSSVGNTHDDSSTFLEAQPLTDADRRVVTLDERKRTDFREFCQSVVSLRLLFAVPENKRPKMHPNKVSNFFNLDQRLGTRDVNDIMNTLVKRSTGPTAKKLKDAAIELLSSIKTHCPKFAEQFDLETGRLPYYQAYLLLHWDESADRFNVTYDDSNIEMLKEYGKHFLTRSFAPWLRRKQQSALLHFAASLRTKSLPLSGVNVVISLADGSIRDFLEIMGEIFDAYVADRKWENKDPTNLTRFAMSRTAISAHIQTNGIYSASETYEAGISHRSEIATDTVQKLVDGLGFYTSILQSNPSDPQVFASSERGVFVVDYHASNNTQMSEMEKKVQTIFKQAELSGYMRVVEPPRMTESKRIDGPSKSIAFRLHRRFSPFFRFSFRGAYEPVRLTPQDVATLCLESETVSAFTWAKRMAGLSDQQDNTQMPLPFEELNIER